MTREAGAGGRKTRRAGEMGFLIALFAPVWSRFERAGTPIVSKQLNRGTVTSLKCRSHPRRGPKPARLTKEKRKRWRRRVFRPTDQGPHRPIALSPFRPFAAPSPIICHLSAALPTACLILESHFIKPLAAMSSSSQTLDGIEIRGPIAENFSEILTPDALRFVARLQREFNGRRKELPEWH